ncbi:MAG: hypothetical protein FJ387_30970, partial [Verrucomicrobia bacterium]|nr:hypothetical protein [Verrucomicrobiota bacterium]
MNGDKSVTAWFESVPALARGFEWKQLNAGTDAWLWNVDFGAGRFVAVGDRGTILTSPDGEAWSPALSPTTKTLWGVHYGNSRFVACGDDGTLLTSANGVDWESMPSGVAPNCVDAAYGSGVYVVVGSQGVILTSPDGAAPWTRQTVNTTGWFMDVSFNEGWFVAGANDGTVAVSQNGRDWTVKNLGADSYMPGTGYGFGRWLVGGRRGSSDAALFASMDLTEWDAVVTGEQTMFAGMALGEGRLVMVGGAEGAGGTGAVLVTLDGHSWQKADFGQVQSLFDVANGNGMWIAVGQAGTIVKGLAAPLIIQHPSNQMVNVGATATLTVAAEGAPPLTYQWKKEGAEVPGATGASLILSNAQSADAGEYFVVVNNGVGSATSSLAALTVTVPTTGPSISHQPQSRTVDQGQSVTFTVLATGTPPLRYQWDKDNVTIPGATDASLTLDNVQPSDAGSYTVMVSNGSGAVTSNPARLTVRPTGPGVNFAAGKAQGPKGTEVSVAVTVRTFLEISAFQFSMHWDPAVAGFVGTEQYGLAGLAAGSFGTTQTGAGTLTVSWDDPDGTGKSLADNSAVFAIRFALVGPPGGSSPVTIDGTPTPIEAVDAQIIGVPVTTTAGQVSITSTVLLSGTIRSTDPARTVQGVNVNLAGAATQSTETGSDGRFSFTVNAGGNYTLSPSKTTDTPPANGVTTADITLIRRHILNSAFLDSPYKV